MSRGRLWSIVAVFLLSLVPLSVAGADAPRARTPIDAQLRPVFDEDYLAVAQELVNRAQEEIYLSIYLFKTQDQGRARSTALQETLIRAARRGVEVRVLFEHPRRTDDFLYRANRDTALEMADFGIGVRWDDPETRMHSKMMVVDQRWTLMGSHNYTVSAFKYNRETSVLIDAPEFAAQARAYIRDLFRNGSFID